MLAKKKNLKRKWFHNRIGKRVYRKHNGCGCKSCLDVTQHGVEITDEQHADYLYQVSSELGYDYFDEPKTKA